MKELSSKQAAVQSLPARKAGKRSNPNKAKGYRAVGEYIVEDLLKIEKFQGGFKQGKGKDVKLVQFWLLPERVIVLSRVVFSLHRYSLNVWLRKIVFVISSGGALLTRRCSS